MRNTQFTRQLRFECLETRRMLDGVITASLQNGTLTLQGDDAANAVLITSSSPGVVELIGLNTTNPSNQTVEQTFINTHTSQFFTGVTNIFVNFNGGTTGINTGNDKIFVTGLALTGGLGIQTGDGNNTYTIGQFDNSGDLIDPTYSSLIGPVSLATGLSIKTGGGDNTLVANQLTVNGAVGNNLNINSGDGTNSLSFSNTTVNHAANFTDTGALTLSFNQFQANNLTVVSGIGNDDITLSNSTIAFKINLNTNFGNDTVHLDHVHSDSLDVALGPGDDQLTAESVTVTHESTLLGGLDNDTVALTNFTPNRSMCR